MGGYPWSEAARFGNDGVNDYIIGRIIIVNDLGHPEGPQATAFQCLIKTQIRTSYVIRKVWHKRKIPGPLFKNHENFK